MRRTITALLKIPVIIVLSYVSAFVLAYVSSYITSYAAAAEDAPLTHDMKLKPGANFVSVPLSVGGASLEGLFSSSLADIESIEYFDTALGKWQVFDPRSWGEQELRDVGDGSAFYIYARKDATVTIYGRSSGFLIPALAAGWNSIGVANPVTVNEFAAKVADFNPVYDRIYKSNDKGELVELKLSDTMEPGAGYWLDNDPDGDGVKSSVELATYKTSPLAHDLVPDGAGKFKVKEAVATSEDNEKSDYLKSKCKMTYTASLSQTLDEVYKECKKLVDTYGEYTDPGDPVILGGDERDSDEKRQESGFKVTSVRYKLGEGGKRIAGVGVIKPEDIPGDLKPLFSLLSAETVFLDLKDEKALRAVGETLNAVTLGGAQGLYLGHGLNETKFDSMVIDRDGGLEIGLVAKVDPIPVQNYFVRWAPDKTKKDTETNEFIRTKDFIQFSMLLGDEEEPGDEVTASRVWFVKAGKAEALLSGKDAWLLNLPPSAKGVFEPYVKVAEKDTRIANSLSPSPDDAFSLFTWMPASPEVSEGRISFTGYASKVRFLSALVPAGEETVGDIPGVSDKKVRVDEKGVISVVGTTLDYRFEKGAFVLGYPTIGLELYFEGWKSALEKSGALKTGLVAAWNPSFKVYLGYRSDDVLKEISAAVPLSVKAGIDIIRHGTTDLEKNLKPRLLGFGWGIDGKLVLNFDGYEVGVEAGVERKESELYKTKDDIKKLISTIVSLQFPSLTSANVDVIFNAKILEQYLVHEALNVSGSSSTFSSDREGYRSNIELTGEGRYRFPSDIPLIGGSDLAAVYRGDLEYKGMDKIVARTQVALSMAEGADTIREEDGWRFSLDELRFELEQVEIEGANSQLEAIAKYLKPTAPKGVKRFTGLMTLNPPSDFVAAGPFVGSFIVERLSKPEDAEQKWRVTASADIDTRIPIEGDDNYLLLRQLVGIKETGQNWEFGALAELRLGGRVIAGNLFFQRGGMFTLMVNGYDLDDTFKGVDLVVNFTKAGDKWQGSVSLGGTISGESLASALGQDASLIKEDFDVRGTLTNDKLIVELANLPASWDPSIIPDWLKLDKVRNITFVRQKMADGTIEKYFSLDMDMIFPKFVDEAKPKDKWPRFTFGAVLGSRGFQLSGRNLGPIDIGHGNSLTIIEAVYSSTKDDPVANKEKKVTGKARVTVPSSWRAALAPVLAIPQEQEIFFEYGPAGFRGGIIYDKAEKITVARNISMKAKEFIITKQSPWGMGLRTELSVGGAIFEGTIGVQDGKARLTLPPDIAITLPIAEGFVADLRNFNIELSGDFALAGDATLLIPEGNVMRKIVGDKLSAKLSGSRTQYSLSTNTNISSEMDMGLLGKASYNIKKIALSSDGSFAGSGTVTLKGQTTAFVIGTKAGGGLYFTADFGEKGIEAKLAQIFTLKLKKSIGLETVGTYQYLRVDDLKAGLGDNLAGADLTSKRFLYFLPSSVPPVGFAFFDNLEGEAHIAGFAVNVGMSFPEPKPKDLGAVVSVLGKAFAGGKVDLTSLDTLSAPTFSLRDVNMNFPKAPGYAWKDGKLQYTDNLFKAMFGKDKLEIVKTASLKPKDFVQMITANTPMDVVKVVVPADKRKGKMDVDLRGFKTNISYDLRADELLYEKKEVKKLPEMYKFINKLSYVDQNAGELPEELKGSGAERSKTVEVVMPAEHGGGKAQVTWKVEDITAELKAIKDMVSTITPASNAKWQDHLSFVWNQFAQKGLTFNGNRAVFSYSPTITGELELNEYDGSLDITGIKFDNSKKLLSARFGTATLYADKNFEGKSLAISDDVTYEVLDKAIGNDKLSSVKIEGRGKVTLYQHSAFQGSSTEVTGSLDSLDDSSVNDNDASSVKVYYDALIDKVTGWRLIPKSDKGIITTVDAGGIEVVFPGDSRVLSLLPNSRLLKAIDDTKNVLNDLKPYPIIDNNPTGFITSFWNSKVLPVKANYLSGSGDLEGTDKPVEFRKDDGSIIGFMPLIYGADKKVAGLKFDKETGILGGKFGKVTIYENANYAGKNLVVEDDIPDLGGTEFGNDAASSIKVEEGAVATLYSGTKYTERWYYDYRTMKTKHSGKCVDVWGGSSGNNANIHQWDCHGGDNQKWKLVPDDGDYYQIVAKHSGKCIDGAGDGNASNILQYECNYGNKQKWKLISKGGGYYQLQSKNSGRCMDESTGSNNNGGNIHQWDCHDGNNQKWLMDLNKAGILTTTIEKETGWLGDYGIGNDSVRSIKVYNPLDINKVKEWKVLQSTPTGGSVVLAYIKDTSDNQYKSVISTELKGTKRNISSYYDETGTLIIKAFAGSAESEGETGAEFPLTNYRAYVKGTPYDLADITEASKYIRIVTKTIKFPDAATAVINEDGGISSKYNDVALSPAEEAPSVTVFTLAGPAGPDGMTLRFNSKKAGGFGAAVIVGSNPLAYAPLYTDDSGIPQGIKKVVGKIEGGFFMDAGLNIGTKEAVQVNLHVSGAIKTDGNYYLKGNGNLVISNFEVSEAVIELSSDKGLLIKGKMDLYGTKVDITGTLSPDNKFSFTGTAQVMVSGNGIKGALEVNNSGVNINGGVYLANKKIVSGGFAVKDGKVSWPTKVSIGSAGFDSTVAVALKDGAASFDGRAYINVDIPIYVWGPRGWKCKRKWGIKVCWPRDWGDIRVGTLGIHHNKTVKGSIDGTAAGIKLGIATLTVDVAKPSVKAKW
ncbi:MAG: RICIN domain-containing protein [Deltaproteobacteria bacterium]|nr:RICIN domain-containing protein [Deltaproteobacteria bacterium]